MHACMQAGKHARRHATQTQTPTPNRHRLTYKDDQPHITYCSTTPPRALPLLPLFPSPLARSTPQKYTITYAPHAIDVPTCFLNTRSPALIPAPIPARLPEPSQQLPSPRFSNHPVPRLHANNTPPHVYEKEKGACPGACPMRRFRENSPYLPCLPEAGDAMRCHVTKLGANPSQPKTCLPKGKKKIPFCRFCRSCS